MEGVTVTVVPNPDGVFSKPDSLIPKSELMDRGEEGLWVAVIDPLPPSPRVFGLAHHGLSATPPRVAC